MNLHYRFHIDLGWQFHHSPLPPSLPLGCPLVCPKAPVGMGPQIEFWGTGERSTPRDLVMYSHAQPKELHQLKFCFTCLITEICPRIVYSMEDPRYDGH